MHMHMQHQGKAEPIILFCLSLGGLVGFEGLGRQSGPPV